MLREAHLRRLLELHSTGHTRMDKMGVEVQAKVDSKFLLPFWKKLFKAARKLIIRADIHLMLDRASVHRSDVTIANLTGLCFTVTQESRLQLARCVRVLPRDGSKVQRAGGYFQEVDTRHCEVGIQGHYT